MNASARARLMLAAALTCAVVIGCESKQPATTQPGDVAAAAGMPEGDGIGFLSTYSNLEPLPDGNARYIDPNNRLARYDKFWIRPVEIFFHTDVYGEDVSEEMKEQLRSTMYNALVDALKDRYQIVSSPSWDAAEVRIGITNLTKSAPILNVLPRLKFIDLGLGGISMEGEVIDSVSSVQIGALVETKTGRNLEWNTSQLDDAEGVMREWAKRFRNTVDEAHGYAPAGG